MSSFDLLEKDIIFTTSLRARRLLVHGNDYLRFTDDKSCIVVIIGIALNITVIIVSKMINDTPIYTAFAFIMAANSVYLGIKRVGENRL